MSTKTRSIIVLMIAVFTMLIVGTTKVNAVEITDEVLNEIPNEISVDLKESEFEKAEELIQNQIVELLNNKGITVSAEDVNVSIKKFSNMRQADITVGNNAKEITVVYSNSKNYSQTEKQKLDNSLKEILKELNVIKADENNNHFDILEFNELGTDTTNVIKIYEKVANPLTKQGYTLIDVTAVGGYVPPCFKFGWPCTYAIYKNDIFYKSIDIEAWVQQEITIPNTVEDTEIARIEYITNRLEEWSEAIKEIKKVVKANGDYYTVTYTYMSYDGEICETEDNILVKREETTDITKEDTTTGIKLETTTATVQSNVTLVANIITDKGTKELIINAIRGVGKFTPYNIDLMQDNIKIQPNGKVKVSIPIPSDYNKDRLTVYRVEEDGTKTEYTVKVEENYATFETDHFSIYVLAEKQATNKGEKDDTPKTGTTDITNYIIAVATISAVGIIALKKKETK